MKKKEETLISSDIQSTLLAHAKEAEKKSYSPYSRFAVGAALITEEGDIFSGCNVENVSYGLSICAERTAIFKMISEKGPTAKIKAFAVTSKTEGDCAPCGACRQVIQEFSTPNTLVIHKRGTYQAVPLEELLPGAFKDFTKE